MKFLKYLNNNFLFRLVLTRNYRRPATIKLSRWMSQHNEERNSSSWDHWRRWRRTMYCWQSLWSWKPRSAAQWWCYTLVLEVCQPNRGQDPGGEHSGQDCGVSGYEHGGDDAEGVHVGGGVPSALTEPKGLEITGCWMGAAKAWESGTEEGADGSSSASARRSSTCRGGGRRCRAWWRHNLKLNLKHHISLQQW